MILVEKVCSRLPFTYWVRIPYAASSDQDKEEGNTEEEEEGVASRRFLPAHLAPVPAHLLDCLSCQHIRGGQQSLYNNKLVTVYYAYQLQNGDVVTFGKWSCGQNVAITECGPCFYVW